MSLNDREDPASNYYGGRGRHGPFGNLNFPCVITHRYSSVKAEGWHVKPSGGRLVHSLRQPVLAPCWALGAGRHPWAALRPQVEGGHEGTELAAPGQEVH